MRPRVDASTVITSNHHATVTLANRTADTPWQAIMIGRRRNLSIQAPAGNPTISHGNQTAAASSPTSKLVALRLVRARIGSTTVVIPLPIPLMTSPVQSRRKSRWARTPQNLGSRVAVPMSLTWGVT